MLEILGSALDRALDGILDAGGGCADELDDLVDVIAHGAPSSEGSLTPR
jgi:hypothetical protein